MAFIPVQNVSVSIGGSKPTNGTIFGCMIYGFQMSFGIGEGQTTCSMNIVSREGKYPPGLTEINPLTGEVKYLSFMSPITLTVGGSFGTKIEGFTMTVFLIAAKETYGSDGKTFQLNFIDGSHILDRVFVGLLHRHDGSNRPVNVLRTQTAFDVPVLCPPCDPFASTSPTRKVITASDPKYGYLATRKIDMSKNIPIGNFIEGGFIIVGSEQYASSDCVLKDVDYNFTELVIAAANIGVKITIKDRKPQYRATHIGTLREVLSAWCGDFGITWVYDCFGGFPPTVNEAGNNSPASVLQIQKINNEIRNIKQTSSTALVESINYEVSIKDTYKQFPVTSYKKQSKAKTYEKTTYYRTFLEHIGPQEMFDKKFLDGRTYDEFIISCVLAKFSPELRTLYLLSIGAYAPLGFTPVYKVPDALKRQIVDTCLNTESYLDMIDYIAGKGATLRNIANADFDMSLGNYQEEMENSYLTWESGVADSFGKYFMTSVLGRDVKFCPKGLNFSYQNKSSLQPEAEIYYSKFEELNKKKACQPAMQNLSQRSQAEMLQAEFDKKRFQLTNDKPGGLPFNDLLRGPLGKSIWTMAPPYLVRGGPGGGGGGAKLKFAEYVRIMERGAGSFNVTEADFQCQLTNPNTKESLVAKYMPRYQEVEGLIKTRLLASFAKTPDRIRETIEGAKGAVPKIMITPKKPRLRKLFSVSALTSMDNDTEGENTLVQKAVALKPKEADCTKTAICEMQEDIVNEVCDCTSVYAPPAKPDPSKVYDSKDEAFIDGILTSKSLGFTFKFKPDPLEFTVTKPDGTFEKQFDIFESSLKIVLPYGMDKNDGNNLYQSNYVEALSRTTWSQEIKAVLNDFEYIHDAAGNRVRPNFVGNVGAVKVIPIEATQNIDGYPTDINGGQVINVSIPPMFNPSTGRPYPESHPLGAQMVTLPQYHAFMQVLNSLGSHLPKVTLSVSLGSMNFGIITKYLKAQFGLQSVDITINETGTSASVSWGSGLLKLPKEDVIMNQVQPRAKYSMFVS